LVRVIPEIDIWRAANLMLKRYGDEALEERAARADELAAQDDYNGAAPLGGVAPRLNSIDWDKPNREPAGCSTTMLVCVNLNA
jgi:hypothetical protein